MRITQEADYALRIIYRLARENRVMDSKSLAESTGVPERFAVKILRKLNLSGILCSFKGSAGGYALAVDPSEISMKRVVEIIDGPLEISRCLDSAYECAHAGDNKECCIFHLVFDKVNRIIAEKLETVTLGDVISKDADVNEILSNI